MRRVLKWLGIGFGALLLLAVGIWVSSRMMGPTEAQERALAVMAQPVDPPPGRNAFPALWLLPYDVPDDQLEAVTAEDMKWWANKPLPNFQNADDAPAQVTAVKHEPISLAEPRFGRIVPAKREGPEYCSSGDPSCLAKVRADLSAYRAWQESNAQLLDHLSALNQYNYLRNQLPPRLEAPFPAMQHFSALPTWRALDFVEGRVDAALAGNCRDIVMFQRFARTSDLLIYTMISAAFERTGTRLFGEMLRELPAEHPLPVECAALSEPPSASDLSLCETMRGEFRYSSSIVASSFAMQRNPVDRLKAALTYNDAKTKGKVAEGNAWYCGKQAADLLRQDLPAKPPETYSAFGLRDYFRCADNALGCAVTRIAEPVYDDYAPRLQDMGARDQLLATLLWLREHAVDRRPLTERLASRPANLKSPSRDIRIVDGGKVLAIRMYDRSREKEFELPLPAYLQDGVTVN